MIYLIIFGYVIPAILNFSLQLYTAAKTSLYTTLSDVLGILTSSLLPGVNVIYLITWLDDNIFDNIVIWRNKQ